MTKQILILLTMLFFLQACGQSGRLYLPPAATETPSTVN